MVTACSREARSFFVGHKYNYAHGPLIETADAIDSGVNCQLIIHILLEECLGVGLPKNMRSFELFFDTLYTKAISKNATILTACEYEQKGLTDFLHTGEQVAIGDIFFFSWLRSSYSCPKYYHMALVTDVSSGEPVLTHAVQFGNVELDTVVTWSLTDIFQRPSGRYGRLLGIKRLLEYNHSV